MGPSVIQESKFRKKKGIERKRRFLIGPRFRIRTLESMISAVPIDLRFGSARLRIWGSGRSEVKKRDLGS